MSFKRIPINKIIWIPLAVWLVKSLYHGLEGKLGAYVHPRFFTFTIVLSVLGLALVVYAQVKPAGPDGHESHQSGPSAWFAVFTLLIAVATAMMPPLTLSAASVINRGSDSYAASSVKLSARYDQFNIKEWSGLLAQTHDTLSLVGKPAAFEGFLSKPQSGDQPAMISRFGVTCCAIDAQPISLPVRSASLEGVQANQWLRIRGVWQRDGAAENGVVIKLTEVTLIDQPKEPYVY